MNPFPLSDVFRLVPFKDQPGTSDLILLQAWTNNFKWETIAAWRASDGTYYIKAGAVTSGVDFDLLGWNPGGSL